MFARDSKNKLKNKRGGKQQNESCNWRGCRERERERVTFLNKECVVTKVVALFVMFFEKNIKIRRLV